MPSDIRQKLPPIKVADLPLDQFAFAELTVDDKEQLFHASFATHEIMVRGSALRRIETAMHRLELSFITQLPAKYFPLLAEGQPRIREIVVAEVRPVFQQIQSN